MDRPSVKGIIAVHAAMKEIMFTVWKNWSQKFMVWTLEL